jgi:FcoT-like thioesterase domain
MATLESVEPTRRQGPATYQTDRALLARVLRVYQPHCRYLKSADVSVDGGNPLARGELVIAESCYIDDTGHFNSVEFNICYNQMLYYLVAKSIKERLIPAFHGWTMEDFWARQLPDFYIATFESIFRTPMRDSHFHGEIRFTKAKKRAGGTGRQALIWLNTDCRYWTDRGGLCSGKVRIAVTNLPSPPSNR